MEDEAHDDTVGWEVVEPNDNSLVSLPKDWSGFTRSAKVQRLVDVITYQIQQVRTGNFDLSKAPQVAALCLEGQMELSEFYAEAESLARDAKNVVDYIEGETELEHKNNVIKDGSKISEQALKRISACDSKVKDAKKQMITLEKEHKKWRYIFETLKEAHIFFRNLSKA